VDWLLSGPVEVRAPPLPPGHELVVRRLRVSNKRGRSHRWLVPSVLVALTVAAVALAAAQADTSGSGRAAGASSGSTALTADSGGTAATSTVSTALTAATSTTVAPSGSTADPAAAAEVAASRSGIVEWAIVDLATGSASGSGSPADPQVAIDAASMGKVLIAVAAVQQGLTASPVQAAELELMIEQSDNTATDHLYAAVGGAATIQALMDATGMEESRAGRNWGAMSITASDMAHFLAQLGSGELLGLATDQVLEPMRAVVADQRWGISEAATATPAAAVKNGWYPDTDGQWRLHCSAIVGSTDPTGADQGVAVVVMTHYSQELGMGYGEETCRLVAAALLPDALVA
jgi:hypothetical protein